MAVTGFISGCFAEVLSAKTVKQGVGAFVFAVSAPCSLTGHPGPGDLTVLTPNIGATGTGEWEWRFSSPDSEVGPVLGEHFQPAQGQ